MSANCVFEFDCPNPIFYSGEVINGRFKLTTKTEKSMQGIKLEIGGYATCQWKDKHLNTTNDEKEHKGKHIYYGHENYIASTSYLVGSEGGQTFTLEAGTYTYSFACSIPANCPSSFDGSYGQIRYFAKATIESKDETLNTVHEIGFTVMKVLNLNPESRLLKVQASNEEKKYLGILHSRPVYLDVDIVQTDCASGQILAVDVLVKNTSRIDCKNVLIFLNMRVIYNANIPSVRTKSEQICLEKKICGSVPNRTEKKFERTLRMASTAPSCENLSKILHFSYEICVVAVMNSMLANAKAIIPITIGNVSNTLSQQRELPSTSSFACQLSHRSLATCPVVDDSDEELELGAEPDIAPPTYEEAMMMTTNDIIDCSDGNGAAAISPRSVLKDDR